MRISDWSSDVCSSDLVRLRRSGRHLLAGRVPPPRHRLARDRARARRQVGAALAAPARACRIESPAAVPLDGEDALRARLALEHRHPLTRHPQARLVQHAQARQVARVGGGDDRSEEHTSELQSLMRISYAVFCLKKKTTTITNTKIIYHK